MSLGRYRNSPRINLGSQLGTSNAVSQLRVAIKLGTIPVIRSFTTSGVERLDVLAGTVYGDAKYWWVLAAASDIGWGLQVPSDTVINVIRLSDIQTFVG